MQPPATQVARGLEAPQPWPASAGTILLVAPNVSARMGGEALKSLNVLKQLVRDGYPVLQVAHERSRNDLEGEDPGLTLVFVADDWLRKTIYRFFGANSLIVFLDMISLHRVAREIVRSRNIGVVHFTSPISPIIPYFRLRAAPVVIGPLNGNITYPSALGGGRRHSARQLATRFLLPLLGRCFAGKREAAVILVAGGNRTASALLGSGCDAAQLVPTLDSGVDNSLADAMPIQHSGRNPRFVFLGRLVAYKGCDLAIRALAVADPSCSLDVIGEGPEEGNLRRLVAELGLEERVNFLGWLPNGAPLYQQLRSYRAFIFPSKAEANGIVVQEAMMIGLPVVALNWAGPAELLNRGCGILIEPEAEPEIVKQIGHSMSQLAGDSELANRLAVAARERALREGFAWRDLIPRWVELYKVAMLRGAQRKRRS